MFQDIINNRRLNERLKTLTLQLLSLKESQSEVKKGEKKNSEIFFEKKIKFAIIRIERKTSKKERKKPSRRTTLVFLFSFSSIFSSPFP